MQRLNGKQSYTACKLAFKADLTGQQLVKHISLFSQNRVIDVHMYMASTAYDIGSYNPSMTLPFSTISAAKPTSPIISFCHQKITVSSCSQAKHRFCAQIKTVLDTLLGERQELVEQQRRQSLGLQCSTQPLQLQPLRST